MGLLYTFPTAEHEIDHYKTENNKKSLLLKSYGLPYFFWFYYLIAFMLIFAMFLIVKGPLLKLYSTQDFFNQILSCLVWGLLLGIPFAGLAFLFYEKRLSLNCQKGELTISHHFFGLRVWKKTYRPCLENPFDLQHHLATPNMVRIKDLSQYKQYYNKGHFELWGKMESGQYFYIDRHSRKSDLEKLELLLKNYLFP